MQIGEPFHFIAFVKQRIYKLARGSAAASAAAAAAVALTTLSFIFVAKDCGECEVGSSTIIKRRDVRNNYRRVECLRDAASTLLSVIPILFTGASTRNGEKEREIALPRAVLKLNFKIQLFAVA